MVTQKTGMLVGAACVAACAAPAVVVWAAAGATATGLVAMLRGDVGIALAVLVAGGGIWWGLQRRKATKEKGCCAGNDTCRLPEKTTQG